LELAAVSIGYRGIRHSDVARRVARMMVTIQRYKLSEMIRAVQEHEKKGFECVTPIRKICDRKKVWNYSRRNNDFLDFGGVQEREFYFVKMRKVD
jgi:hypothetical protein